MFSTRTFAFIGALVTATATAAHAQEIDMSPPAAAPTSATPAPATGDDAAFHKGTLGFSFPFTLLSNISGSVGGVEERVPTIDLVYFLNDKAAVDLIGGLNFHRKQATDATGAAVDTNLFGFALGAGYRAYSSKNSLRSFIEPQVVLSWPDTSDSATFTLNAGVEFGLERNITSWFSISGAVGGGLNFTNSFKDIQIATQANLAANLYWH
ncbi:MAG TPA: hypothetical protein VH165_16275 [Kofleriaceae bacterium]|nr:hypothetical protein [Kofleriaceae bacterium]